MLTRSEAEQAAADILRSAWNAEDLETCVRPVDPFHIAATLGLRVEVRVLEPDVSGMLAKRPGQDPEVYINASDGRKRQRFSCAHEIGHYTHRSQTSDSESWGYIDRRGPLAADGTNPEEIYANQFAAALLMPEPAVRKLSGKVNPAALAVEFDVSLGAMHYRLENLGLNTS